MQAKCLCGAVTLTAPDVSEIGACHCGMCRRWSGGPFLALHCGTGVEFSGREKIKNYQSSQWADRAFCADCGTHLYYKLKATGEYFVPAGLFSEIPDATLRSQIFIDNKPDYYSFSNETENLTEAEVYAKYVPK